MKHRSGFNAEQKRLFGYCFRAALKVASFNSFSGSDHHDGTKSHRIGMSRRLPFCPTIVSIVVVGQTLRTFLGATDRPRLQRICSGWKSGVEWRAAARSARGTVSLQVNR
jgi:hypothetical protein